VPEPGPGEVLVRVKAALTCGTDAKIARRGHPKFPFPLTLGHEWAGVVERAGAGAAWEPGTRVTSAVSAPCGACPACAAGRENLCATAFETPLFGAFADYLLVPERIAKRGLRRVPDGMSDEAAALLDPLASVVRALKRVGSARGGDVLVTGTGPIAAMLFFLLRGKDEGIDAPGRIVVVGRRPERLAFFEANGAEVARVHSMEQALGAGALPLFTFEENPPSSPRVARPTRSGVTERAGARSFSLVVDTTGDPGVIAALPGLTADGGTVLLFAGLPEGAHVAVEAHAVHYREVSVIGSFHYTPREVDETLALLSTDALPVGGIVSARRPLAEWEAAFALAKDGTALKVALVP